MSTTPYYEMEAFIRVFIDECEEHGTEEQLALKPRMIVEIDALRERVLRHPDAWEGRYDDHLGFMIDAIALWVRDGHRDPLALRYIAFQLSGRVLEFTVQAR